MFRSCSLLVFCGAPSPKQNPCTDLLWHLCSSPKRGLCSHLFLSFPVKLFKTESGNAFWNFSPRDNKFERKQKASLLSIYSQDFTEHQVQSSQSMKPGCSEEPLTETKLKGNLPALSSPVFFKMSSVGPRCSAWPLRDHRVRVRRARMQAAGPRIFTHPDSTKATCISLFTIKPLAFNASSSLQTSWLCLRHFQRQNPSFPSPELSQLPLDSHRTPHAPL